MEQFKELVTQMSRARSFPVRGDITVTGGEPFCRQDFLDLLDVFHANRDLFHFAILTNGSLIDEAMAHRLSKLGPSFVQVSIEGTQDTNDSIRGQGSFERTVMAIKHLVQKHIRTYISFTGHRDNLNEFTEVARLGCEFGVSRVWADRLIPWGSGSALREKVLSPDETQEFFKIMHRAQGEAMQNFCRTEISMHRALQFLVAGGRPYHCGAGDTLITIQPNGDLYPCRRMPIHVGNVMERRLVELYYESDLFRALRNRECVNNGCEDCFFSSKCRGGLKCLSYALTGDPFNADPGCWRAITK